MSGAEWEQNSDILPGASLCVPSRFKIKLHHTSKPIQPQEDFSFHFICTNLTAGLFCSLGVLATNSQWICYMTNSIDVSCDNVVCKSVYVRQYKHFFFALLSFRPFNFFWPFDCKFISWEEPQIWWNILPFEQNRCLTSHNRSTSVRLTSCITIHFSIFFDA